MEEVRDPAVEIYRNFREIIRRSSKLDISRAL